MQVTNESFTINNKEFKWGTTLQELADNLGIEVDNEQRFPSVNLKEFPRVHLNGQNFYGLDVFNEMVTAKYEDGPIMLYMCEVEPLQKGFLEKLHSPYFKVLKKKLGEPTEISSNYQGIDMKSPYASSSDIYSATWHYGHVSISLSVYGGLREVEDNLSGAGIFIHWLDEEKAAEEWIKKNRERGEDMVKQCINRNDYEKFYFSSPFSPEFPEQLMAFEKSNGYVTSYEAKMALFNRALFPTSKEIKNLIGDNEIIVYKLGDSQCFIATKYESSYLDNNAEIRYNVVHPFKGPGGQELIINGISMWELKDSSRISELVKYLEEEINFEVIKSERYDD